MEESILYEPRAFWSIANATLTSSSLPTRIRLNKEHFRNGSRWPIQLTSMSLCGVNYTLLEGDTGVSGPGAAAGATMLHRVDVGVTSPQRFHLNTKSFAIATSLAPRPTAIGPRSALVGGNQPSSLYGSLSVLRPAKPIYIPRMGSIEWALSSFTPWRTDADSQTERPSVTMLYQEEGGLFAGSARSFEFNLNFLSDDALNDVIAQGEQQERWPFLVDQLSAGSNAIIGGTANWWDPRHLFNSKQFNSQESTRSGSTKITELRCHINQRDMDTEAQTGLSTTSPLSPMSMRVGTRIRMTNGGSNTDWWRPGAPLALVFPDMTPANVYDLPHGPVTLAPGDALDVEMRFPPPPAASNEQGEYHIGIAFNGYAAIQG